MRARAAGPATLNAMRRFFAVFGVAALVSASAPTPAVASDRVEGLERATPAPRESAVAVRVDAGRERVCGSSRLGASSPIVAIAGTGAAAARTHDDAAGYARPFARPGHRARRDTGDPPLSAV